MKDSLHTHKASVFSGDGEDGVIEEIFARIGERNHWCVEFGALNGTHDSNSRNLLLNKQWSGVLIEADRTYFEKLADLYKDNPRVACLNEFVSFEGPHSLDVLFSATSLPKEFDLLSIDIDGNDYHVWESLKAYQPRVVVIEFNPTIPNDIDFVQPRDMRVQQGSSLQALLRLGKSKGYVLVAVVGTNAFFVTEKDFPALGVKESSLNELYTDTTFHTRLFQLYDGTLVLSGCNKLLWRDMPIDAESIQVLPRRKRVFTSGIRAHPLARGIVYWVRRSPAYPLIQYLRRSLFS